MAAPQQVAYEVATTATSAVLAVGEHAEKHYEGGVHVSLAADRVGHLWGIPITNTLVTSWIVMLLLFVIAFAVRSRLKMVPGRLQTAVELLFTTVFTFMRDTLEDDKWARRLFPLLITLFLFIGVSNVTEFTPGIGSILVHTEEGSVPLLRSVNSDLNVTLALTIVAVLAIEISGIIALGFFTYAGKFINFSSPTNFFVGLIELVSELSRFVSFSFRLFGNIFAGKVLVGVAAFFVPIILPVPIMAFEIFVGIVQAAVFALLTLFFVKMAIMKPHGSHH